MPTDPIQAAWHRRAEELADWALPLFFARTDRYGGYYVRDGTTRKCARPERATPNVVHRGRVLAHFRATRTDHVMGPFSLGPDPSAGRVASADVDAHPAEGEAEAAARERWERNRRYAEHLYYNLAGDLGLRPLLATWGAGSFHLHALFDRPVPGELLFRFGRWLVADAPEHLGHACESYPKQASTLRRDGTDGYGNWLRLVGRHHTRDAWASVFDGATWLAGDAAIAHVLTLTGDSPDLIPEGARTFDPDAARKAARPAAPRPEPTAGDVFALFNAAQTMASVGAILQRNRWEPAGWRGERWDFRRPGTANDKSGNLMLVDGVPLFYGFTDAGGITHTKGLTPTRLRAELEFAGDFARLAQALRAEGYGPPVQVRELPTAAAPATPPAEPPASKEGGRTPPAPPEPPVVVTDTGPPRAAAVILDHFRRRYRPLFRVGTALMCADGVLVSMGEGCSLSDSDVIDRLALSSDAPTHPKTGEVKLAALPGLFRSWSRTAWGDLLKALPDEVHADLADDALPRVQFRQLVRDAMLTRIALPQQIGGESRDQAPTQLVQLSLIRWCKRFAKARWADIRDHQCFCKVVVGARPGDLELCVAVRQSLFRQIKADRRLCDLTQYEFTVLAQKYGVGTRVRACGQDALQLDPPLVAELLGGMDDGSEAAPQILRLF